MELPTVGPKYVYCCVRARDVFRNLPVQPLSRLLDGYNTYKYVVISLFAWYVLHWSARSVQLAHEVIQCMNCKISSDIVLRSVYR